VQTRSLNYPTIITQMLISGILFVIMRSVVIAAVSNGMLVAGRGMWEAGGGG
jgi:hypothetical protein